MFKEIPIKDIIVPKERRKLRDIKPLAESIDENGLLHPIIINEDNRLIAGLHRLRACEALRLEKVTVKVLSVDEMNAQFAEIDENLIRNELTTLERAELLSRRKQLYEAKYPQVRRGGDRKSEDYQNSDSFIKLVPSFASNTAQLTKFTPRSIWQDLYIARKLAPDVIKTIQDSPLEKRKRDLLKIAKLSPDQQQRVVEKSVTEPNKNIDAIIQEDAVEKTLSQVDDKSKLPEISSLDPTEFLDTIEPKSIDLLLTDPPHSESHVENLVLSWVPRALSKLKDSGQAYIVTSNEPEELQAYLRILSVEPRFKIEKILVHSPEDQLPMKASIKTYRSSWQAIFYLRGPEAKLFDCPIPEEQLVVQTASNKTDLAERLIRHASKPLDKVLDPFAGDGTVLLAAARLRRKPLGCETDNELLKTAERAGCLISE